jgi:hypothetical protein
MVRIFVVSFVNDDIEPIKIRLDDTELLTISDIVQLINSHLNRTLNQETEDVIVPSYDIIRSEKSFKLQYYNKLSGRMAELNEASVDNIQTSGQTFIQVEFSIPYALQGKCLAITGRHFSLSRPLTILGQQVAIAEQEEAVLGTGLKTWDGAVVLAKVRR